MYFALFKYFKSYRISFRSFVASIYLSMSSKSFLGVTRAYTWVVPISACPSILLTVSIGTPFSNVIRVENECLAVWEIIDEARGYRMVS